MNPFVPRSVGTLRDRSRLALMAVTTSERKLLVAGEWIETGDWVEVRSPYSGELVSRVAKAGAAETTRAIDAAERRCSSRCPRTSAPRSSSRSSAGIAPAARRGRQADLRRGRQAAQGGPRRGLARDVDLHLRRGRGAQARGRDGADGRGAGRRGQARASRCAGRSGSSARSRRSTSRSTSSRTSSRRRSPPAAPSCSSPRARRRSRRCCSPSSRRRQGCRPAG